MIKNILKKEIWEIIPDLKIDNSPAPYGVLNEKSVRATAGIMFLVWIITLLTTYFTKDFSLVKIVLPLFFINFIILVFFWPKYSPISKLGKYLVKNQKPEYVWAIQKRFAWMMWLIMSFIVMVVIFIFGINGFVPLLLCSICLALMWMETSLWICVWCNIYWYLINKNIISSPKIKPACPGWVCSLKK